MANWTNSSDHVKGVIAIIIAATLWSTGGVFIKLIDQNAFTILFYRSVLASLVFLAIFKSKVFIVNWRSLLSAFVYASILILFVSSTKLTTAANAIFLQYTAPFYVLIAEPLLFKLKLQKVNVVAIIICIGGMFLFVADDFGGGQFLGNMMALGSGVSYATFLLLQRSNEGKYHEGAIFWGNIIVALVGIPFFLESHLNSTNELLMLVFLGVFQIGVAYAFFNYSLKRILAIENSLISIIEPVLNPVWVFLFYGETPGKMAIAGGSLILFGLVFRAMYLYRGKRMVAE